MIDPLKKPVFKFKSRIITKSLLRILCILLPVICLFQYMSYSGQETESRLETERNNLEFSTRVNRAGSSASLASADLLIHLLMNSDKATVGWLKHRQAAIEETQKLENIARRVNVPLKNKYVSKLVRQTYATFDYLSQLNPAASTMEIRSVVTNLKVLRQYFLYVFEVHNLFHTMEKDEQARLIEAIEQGKKERVAFNQLLNIALLVLFTTAVALVFQFSKEITDRLKIVVENASRLPQREKLKDAVQGSDEISFLDSTLHETADKLEQSAMFRKNLLEMVAHDMCSPLRT